MALLGLAFKAGTEDVRESRALPIARGLVDSGALVRAHDPVAGENFWRAWKGLSSRSTRKLRVMATVEEALNHADAAILHADWPEYLRWRPAWSRRMKRPMLIDLRRAVPPEIARKAGLTVIGLGAGTADLKTSGPLHPGVR